MEGLAEGFEERYGLLVPRLLQRVERLLVAAALILQRHQPVVLQPDGIFQPALLAQEFAVQFGQLPPLCLQLRLFGGHLLAQAPHIRQQRGIPVDEGPDQAEAPDEVAEVFGLQEDLQVGDRSPLRHEADAPAELLQAGLVPGPEGIALLDSDLQDLLNPGHLFLGDADLAPDLVQRAVQVEELLEDRLLFAPDHVELSGQGAALLLERVQVRGFRQAQGRPQQQ